MPNRFSVRISPLRQNKPALAAFLLLLLSACMGGGGGDGNEIEAADNVISPPAAWSDRLAAAAYLHSADMARNGFLSHTGSDGSSAGERIARQGYSWRTYGENVAVGQATVSAVVSGWLGSEGRCPGIK